MQNTINEIAAILSAHESKSVDEYNSICDVVEARDSTIEKLEQSLAEQSNILVKQHDALLVQDKNKSTLLLNQDSLKHQLVSLQLSNKTLEHQIKVLKKEAKAAKEQITRNKAALKVRDSKISKLEKKKPNTDGIQPLVTIYSKGSDVLLIYPSKLTLGVNGVKQEQTVLLYTNRCGAFVTAFLDNDNEVAFSSFINKESEIADRTKALINKNTMQVSDEAAKFAQDWLIRVNLVQKQVINPVDMACFKA